MIGRLSFPAEWKAVAGSSRGELDGYGVFFGNIDLGGDVASPGSCRKTLTEREASGRPWPLDAVTVDHEGKTPVYLQIAAILRDAIERGAIERGDYPPGRAIPSETRLMQEHGIARLTARKAVRVLADEGLVEVVRGRGAYVAER